MHDNRSGRALRRAAWALIAGALALSAAGCNGCSKGDGAARPEGSAAKRQAKASGSATAGPTRPPLLGALEKLEVREDQKARVHAVSDKLEAQTKVVRETKAKLTEALAAGVRANKIDRAALAPQIEAVKKAALDAQAGMQTIFDELHATLDATQRKALLAAMKKELESHRGAKGEGRFRIDELATEMDLSTDQIASIRTKLREHVQNLPQPEGHDRRPVGQQHRAFASAFEGETFEAKTFDLGAEGGAMAERGADMLIASAEAALPVLTPEQRNTLADKLVERARRGE